MMSTLGAGLDESPLEKRDPDVGEGAPADAGSLRWLIFTAVLIALAAKIYCASTTFGTTDTFLFYAFAERINTEGLLTLYTENRLFNHTPLVAEFVAAAWELNRIWGSGFALMLRLPGIAADVVAVFALIWLRGRTGRPEPWAIVLFALSPVAFMVSGYHGNLDSLLTALLLLATCFCVGNRPLECGFFLGLACNIKVVSLLLGPIFFFFWLHRGHSTRFALGAVATTLAGWAPALSAVPTAFLSNVLCYGGYWGDWGITYFLSEAGWSDLRGSGFLDVSPAQSLVITSLKGGIIAGVISLAWRRRSADPRGLYLTLSLTWAIMFVFAPGGAPQYMVWFAPFMLLVSTRWYAALTLSSTVFLFVFYNTVSHGIPWNKGISTLEEAPLWRPWTIFPWSAFVLFLGYQFNVLPTLRSLREKMS